LNSTSGSVSVNLDAVTDPATARRPTQARAHKTRAALVGAAQREFSERGYAATTARSIADRARVATGSFYQYFTNKDEVLLELASQRAAWIGDETVGWLERAASADLPTDPAARAELVRMALAKVVAVVIDLHREDPGLHAVLTERRHADPELEALTATREAMLVDRVARLLSRWDHPGDCEATAFVLFGAIEGSVHAHVLSRAHVSDERFVAALVDALQRICLPTP
jgi:AcrR family transcriptional regulator